ncbi:MAG: inositol monophosphatase [Dictyoglomus sp.]|nr:inositol monophosphatase [Dictyoglomus sp.]MCX7941950.1 inositol monophosphatase [Dictyoglomaceae bacterium]MDW8189114.1 inositol monophosphatase family protein [Dictyoglomus sp.]
MRSIFEVMIESAFMAGDILRKYYENGNFVISQKTTSYDLVTTVDKESQEVIISFLSSKFPHIPILGEEGFEIKRYERAFFVDPLDGTLNFVHKIPFFAISIGYWEDNKPKLGLVYDPIRRDLFYAKEGEGAFLNGKRIHVSSPSSLENSIFVTGWPYDKKKMEKAINFANRLLKYTEYRALGSASLELCYVGMGNFDGYFEFGLYPWDLAGGVLIAKEAGAKISKPNGEEFDLFDGEILAIAPSIYEEFLRAISS